MWQRWTTQGGPPLPRHHPHAVYKPAYAPGLYGVSPLSGPLRVCAVLLSAQPLKMRVHDPGAKKMRLRCWLGRQWSGSRVGMCGCTESGVCLLVGWRVGVRIADQLAWQVLIAMESASLIHKMEKWLEGHFVPK